MKENNLLAQTLHLQKVLSVYKYVHLLLILVHYFFQIVERMIL